MTEDKIYEQVIKDFKKTGSVKKTANNVGTTLVRAQKILITEGLWSSTTSENVGRLYAEGLTVSEIACKLVVSEKTVQAYLPYTRGIYGGEDCSYDAKKSKDYRTRIEIAADKQVVKRISKKRDSTIQIDNKSISEKELVQMRQNNSDNNGQKRQPDVLKIRLELNLGYLSEADRESLKKYGKVKNGIIREILVPADITLHGLHYAIQKCFGWQNSHLHQYRFPAEVFQQLTGGENLTDKNGYLEYDGKFLNWVKLCGIYFRFPCDDFEDIYWDDDYIGGVSFKTWLRKKYTGPYVYGGKWENYHFANFAAKSVIENHPMISIHIPFRKWRESEKVGKLDETNRVRQVPIEKATISDVQQGFEGRMDELLERIPLIQLLLPKDSKENAAYEQVPFIAKLQEKSDENLSVVPLSKELIYAYDFGDGWEVKITCEECFYVVDVSDMASEMYVDDSVVDSVHDEATLRKTKVFTREHIAQDEEVSYEIAKVKCYKKPLCVEADGLNVMDDVGGVHGYIDFLVTNKEGKPEEKESNLLWAKGMGWSGRMSKPQNIL